jgi:hypothetical protein
MKKPLRISVHPITLKQAFHFRRAEQLRTHYVDDKRRMLFDRGGEFFERAGALGRSRPSLLCDQPQQQPSRLARHDVGASGIGRD